MHAHAKSQLSKPLRGSRLLREPDPVFIRGLKDNMLKDPVGTGASPLVVLCGDMHHPEEFQERYFSCYKYEVLGGLHTFMAKLQLLQEMPDVTSFRYAIAGTTPQCEFTLHSLNHSS